MRESIDNKTSSVTDVIYINPCQLYTDSKNITWEDDNKEIVFNGELFDIVSIENENGKVKINAISDKKESEYKMSYAQNEDLKSSATNSPLKLLKQLINLKFTQTTIHFNSFSETQQLLFKNNTSSISFLINSGYKTLVVPPPNC